jgi:hypothetical protein
MAQCTARDIQPGPLASFQRWKELGRHVKSGAKALSLCMPITGKRKQIDDAGNEKETTYQFFALKSNWFVLSQTEGADYTAEALTAWDETEALMALDVTKVTFDVLNGNAQGYAAPDRKVSASLELPGIEYSRGYIQSWAEGQPISDKSAQRIFAAADRLLRAGTEEPA